MCEECRSDADIVDARRERVYDLLAAVLAHPDAGTWGRATNPDEQALDVAAVDALRGDEASEGDLDLRALMVELCQPLNHLKADYDRFFVKSRRNSHSPLEMDHKTAWLRRRPDRAVEELSREYDAAGAPEHDWEPSRPDHAARELGFMAWLIARSRFQRRMACLGARDEEAVRGCDLAQREFFGHHLAGWLPELADQLREYAGGGCLEQLGRFLAAWITRERRYLAADPRFAGAIAQPEDEATAVGRGSRRREVVSA